MPEADRACSSYYIEHGTARILVDCGPGAVQALARLNLPWPELTHLFITHFHSDHVGALPGLFFALRHGIHPPRVDEPLAVYGPPGTRRLFRGLSDVLGDFLTDPGFPVTVTDVVPGTEVRAGDVSVGAQDVPHTPESIALRFDVEEGCLVYTGDTGPDEALIEFSRGAQVLVAECSLPDELVGDNHLSPTRVARLAERARAARLVVTHVYPQFRESADVLHLIHAAGYAGPKDLAREGLRIDIGGSDPPSA